MSFYNYIARPLLCRCRCRAPNPIRIALVYRRFTNNKKANNNHNITINCHKRLNIAGAAAASDSELCNAGMTSQRRTCSLTVAPMTCAINERTKWKKEEETKCIITEGDSERETRWCVYKYRSIRITRSLLVKCHSRFACVNVNHVPTVVFKVILSIQFCAKHTTR